jgi:tetratricopeptide (TPR) repeat protein
MTKFPENQSVLIGLINYYLNSGDDTARLFELFEDAKKNEPDNASLYYVEGNARKKLGQTEEALAAYDKATQVNPNYEWGYIGKGIALYDLAVELQDKANNEMDNDKYMALMGEFEKALKGCIEPFEKAFNLVQDNEIKANLAEYLKNACFRFRNEGAEFQAKYDKYNAAASQR